MENAALLVLVESVLGKGAPTSKGNYAFKCPFCAHHKNKLEVSLRTTAKKENFWHCWVCDTKGKTIRTLFKQAKATPDKFTDLNLLIQPTNIEDIVSTEALALPAEYIALNGILNYFVARAYKESDRKYKNPPVASKEVIGLELYINWDAPIILCEGMFDAITIKRNVIPLLGKVLHNKLMEKLVKSSVDRIYIALDNDAKKDALKHAEKLMSYGKEVYMVELEGKDANEIGFESFLNTLEHTQPLTFQSLLEKKLQNI